MKNINDIVVVDQSLIMSDSTWPLILPVLSWYFGTPAGKWNSDDRARYNSFFNSRTDTLDAAVNLYRAEGIVRNVRRIIRINEISDLSMLFTDSVSTPKPETPTFESELLGRMRYYADNEIVYFEDTKKRFHAEEVLNEVSNIAEWAQDVLEKSRYE